MSKIADGRFVDYHDDNIAMFSRFGVGDGHPHTSVLVDGMMFVLVLNGEVSLRVDDEEFVLHGGDVLPCRPHCVVEGSRGGDDLDMRVMILSTEYMARLINLVNIDIAPGDIANAHKTLPVGADGVRRLQMYFDLLLDKLRAPATTYREDSTDLMIASMVYELHDARMAQGRHDASQKAYSAAENLLLRFLKILYSKTTDVRSVNDYAAQLFVSPKYLSAVCKRLTGRTAGEMIDAQTVRLAQLLLRDKSMSLKQIADTLRFRNQSHFGTFFRRHIGMSPMQYRESCKGISKYISVR